MRLPNSFNIIDKTQLRSMVKGVVKAFQINKGSLDIREDKLKEILYDLCIYELKKNRWFYKGLNIPLLQGILKEESKGYSFKQGVREAAPKKDIFTEFDELTLKKVSGFPINLTYYNRLKKDIADGLLRRD